MSTLIYSVNACKKVLIITRSNKQTTYSIVYNLEIIAEMPEIVLIK